MGRLSESSWARTVERGDSVKYKIGDRVVPVRIADENANPRSINRWKSHLGKVMVIVAVNNLGSQYPYNVKFASNGKECDTVWSEEELMDEETYKSAVGKELCKSVTL